MDKDTSVKVALRIRPLNDIEINEDGGLCINTIPGGKQVLAGTDTYFSYDYVFGTETQQEDIFNSCVAELVDAAFEGFNATILAYGQTGSGKTYTMGSSSSESKTSAVNVGIIPRVIDRLFSTVREKEEQDPDSSYKIFVQFLEIYGEDIKDLLDETKTSKVTIRETVDGEVFVSGAREELVNSQEQMFKTLDDGTRHRVTAATKMNQTSSRSHAIFTVILEHTIHGGVMDALPSMDENSENKQIRVSHSKAEIRKCKFHFVDLAGSERAKRTGAQGQQLKEGIDINKGLLALGNVISALGDETKKGKVFVPYRDSKLTRILQDSLGGNSKTLMICCVSPALLNYHESVNALRYANRARNIKNKPIVNRDPTLVMIDQLKDLLKMVSSELLVIKKSKQYEEDENGVSIEILQGLVENGEVNGSTISTVTRSIDPSPISNASSNATPLLPTAPSGSGKFSNSVSAKNQKPNEAIQTLKNRVAESDYELQRLTEQLKNARQQINQFSDQILLTKSERDFFKMKWTESDPAEAARLESITRMIDDPVSSASNDSLPSSRSQDGMTPSKSAGKILEEKNSIMSVVGDHLREIEGLKRQLAQQNYDALPAITEESDTVDEDELSSSVAVLIAKTQKQLKYETERMKKMKTEGNSDDESEEDDQKDDDAEQEEMAYRHRQKLLTTEVKDLGESIHLKEQLLTQLTKSQHQYHVMKVFYEQKLILLSAEVQEAEADRARMLNELNSIADRKDEALAIKQEREKKLRQDLQKKEEQLFLMKKKQDEFSKLSQTQGKYMTQLTRLQEDIVSMKKQRVDLTKTLQQEKKQHTAALKAKAMEIEKLKKELAKSATEIKKLGRGKEIAEGKAREAMKEGALLKKKAQDFQKINTSESLAANTRAAIRAMTKANRMSLSGMKRILSEEELRTKKWIDKRINEISEREAAAENLKRQYEKQLELLNRKAELEEEKTKALEIQETKAAALSRNEEKKLLELEESLSSVVLQIDNKNNQINEIQNLLNNRNDIVGSERTIEVLKRTAAGSLPASHELIRLLFDMLVGTNKALQNIADELKEAKSNEKSLLGTIDKINYDFTLVKRKHDLELTNLAHDYELKLNSLFMKLSHENASDDTNNSKDDKSFNNFQKQLNIAKEETNFLKEFLEIESNKVGDLYNQLEEIEIEKQKLIREVDNKNLQIKFLEEERSLFKDMTEKLREGLGTLGKAGKTIVDNIKENSRMKGRKGGLFQEYTCFIDENNDDEEDDTESLMDEYDFIAEEINRTGSVNINVNYNSNNSHNQSVRAIVYDRLTNPQNYTGAMKKVFEKDLEQKRKKIRQNKTYHAKIENSKRDQSKRSSDPAKYNSEIDLEEKNRTYYGIASDSYEENLPNVPSIPVNKRNPSPDTAAVMELRRFANVNFQSSNATGNNNTNFNNSCGSYNSSAASSRPTSATTRPFTAVEEDLILGRSHSSDNLDDSKDRTSAVKMPCRSNSVSSLNGPTKENYSEATSLRRLLSPKRTNMFKSKDISLLCYSSDNYDEYLPIHSVQKQDEEVIREIFNSKSVKKSQN